MEGKEIKIKWIGQSGYIIRRGKTELYIDPYLSDAAEKASGVRRMVAAPIRPEEIEAGAVICTHDHLDHLDPGAIVKMNKEIDFYAPSGAHRHLRSLGAKRIHAFDEGAVFNIGGLRIEAVFAEHTVQASGVLAKAGGYTLYFTGDTYYNEKLAELGERGIDVLFVCINGRLGNMNVKEAVRLAKEIKPSAAVPNHYGMFAENTEDPLKFTNGLDNGFIMEFNRWYGVDEIMRKNG